VAGADDDGVVGFHGSVASRRARLFAVGHAGRARYVGLLRAKRLDGPVNRLLEGRQGLLQTGLVVGRGDEPGLARVRLAENSQVVVS
jgi:hypothetical protein